MSDSRPTDCASAATAGALHTQTSKKLGSRAPKAVGLHARVGLRIGLSFHLSPAQHVLLLSLAGMARHRYAGGSVMAVILPMTSALGTHPLILPIVLPIKN